ncbi:DNA-binding response OmpR family regulator [Haloferula luteola]|uniref:DNA-binding response OmpR family regulator n=1 Tax=Haloferula luteola TaxID=595692 RepID=A0A840V565_9BACT|nr:response regulator transcription factor [Haloferula luteola]MBB5350774.1 DNA-binding response OmpR family regulator [Haloferula luteola]
MRCLIIEDYPPLRENIAECLREEGYAVDSSATGDEGLWYARNHPYDVLILDIMLPAVDGLTILRQLRDLQDKTPVLIISARDSIHQRIEGLDAGADDYLVKPFALSEMVARVRALVRRLYDRETAGLQVADLTIDTITRSVRRGSTEITLTPREYALLEYLAYRAGQPVSRTDIWEHVYEDHEGGSSNTVDVYIGYLRKKLHLEGLPELIHTRRGFGYLLAPPVP